MSKQTAANNALLRAAKPVVNAPIYALMLAAGSDAARVTILYRHDLPSTVEGLRAVIAGRESTAAIAARVGARLPRGTVCVKF